MIYDEVVADLGDPFGGREIVMRPRPPVTIDLTARQETSDAHR